MNNPTVKNFITRTSADGDGAKTARTAEDLRQMVNAVVSTAPVIDLHTHLFPAQFGDLNLYGIDELLNYHYLIAEFFRYSNVSYEEFWRMEKRAQADSIWQTLFVENTPLSEATRGVVNVLNALGLDTRRADLSEARQFFARQKPQDYLEKVLTIANVSAVVMTNDPLDEAEIKVWHGDEKIDARFYAALRLDRILNGWRDAAPLMEKQGYKISSDLSGETITEVRRFLDDWIAEMKPLYLGVSLPDDFDFPENSERGKLIAEAVLPACRAHDLPLALMIGVRRQVNPALKLAGDGLGRADVSPLTRICRANPDVKFLTTFLSRENQHELCVVARKFSNLMPFGCWWFLNNDSIISEITRERFEMLGTSFIPQHSDARVLDQLIYKWDHSRRAVADALCESYENLRRDGRTVTKAEIERDAEKLFAGNFRAFVGMD